MQQSWLELRLCLSGGFQRANNLDCRRTSGRRKAFRCGGIGESLDCLLQRSNGRAAPFTSFGSFNRTQSCARTMRHAGQPSRPACHKRPTAKGPMLNSARRHCISPRRGRRVEWSDQRPGNVRLHFWARRSRRQRASDAGYDSVGNAGSIDVTTSDIPLRTDSVKRCKG